MKKCKAIILVIVAMLCLTEAANATTNPAIVDGADVLFQTELQQLKEEADNNEKYGIGTYLLYIDSLLEYDYSDTWTLACDFYNLADYGIGTEKNGILLVVSIDDHEYSFCFNGSKAESLFTEARQDDLEDAFVSYLSDGNYYEAGMAYLQACRLIISDSSSDIHESHTIVNENNSHELSNQNDYQSEWFRTQLMAMGTGGAAFGAMVAGVSLFFMKKKMKTTKIATDASRYRNGMPLVLKNKNDVFITRTVHRQRLRQDSGRGNHGSSMHSGFGGSFHSGGGYHGTSHSGGGFHGRSGKF